MRRLGKPTWALGAIGIPGLGKSTWALGAVGTPCLGISDNWEAGKIQLGSHFNPWESIGIPQ